MIPLYSKNVHFLGYPGVKSEFTILYEIPTLKTVHKTVSEHGGVVRDPLYLKNPFVFLGNKSTNGNVSISCVSSLETCINYVIALLIGGLGLGLRRGCA